MTAWLIVNAVLLALFAWSCRVANRATGDNFGAVFPMLVLGAVLGVSAFAYLVTAFWLHRFV